MAKLGVFQAVVVTYRRFIAKKFGVFESGIVTNSRTALKRLLFTAIHCEIISF